MAHAVEVYNNGCALENGRGDGAALLDQLLNEGRDILAIATDDAHFRFDDACGGWVMVKAEENEPDALLAALKAGDFYASQGPEIHAAEIAGGALHVECSPAVSIAAVGRGSRSVSRPWPAADARRALAGALRRRLVPLRRRDAAGKLAWSNPVRLPAA